jgi:SMI1-KNR4 cell-wall
MIDKQFLANFKRATEAKWATESINPSIFGSQFQRGPRWLPGLSDEQIASYEREVGIHFPHDFRAFLQEMNGTDLATRIVYDWRGAYRTAVGIYSYPRDLKFVRDEMDMLSQHRAGVTSDLASQGFDLDEDAKLVPIYGHRYIVCTQNLSSSAVVSIVVNDIDAVVYGDSLEDYLIKEFLSSLAPCA